MENALYQDSFFTLTVESQIKKCFYLKLGQLPKNSDVLRNGFVSIILIIRQLQKESKFDFLLMDFQNTKPFISDDCQFMGEKFLPQIVHLGITRLGLLNPKSLFTQYSIEDIIDTFEQAENSSKFFDLKIFNSIGEAQIWMINEGKLIC